jgi:hypothetical protein
MKQASVLPGFGAPSPDRRIDTPSILTVTASLVPHSKVFNCQHRCGHSSVFDVARGARHHVAFGYGIHLAIPVADPPFKADSISYGVHEFPVAWSNEGVILVRVSPPVTVAAGARTVAKVLDSPKRTVKS